MKLSTAVFIFDNVQVVFGPGRVDVNWPDGRSHSVDNTNRRYKPCVTHCEELIRLSSHKPEKTEHEKQRRRASKPALRLRGA